MSKDVESAGAAPVESSSIEFQVGAEVLTGALDYVAGGVPSRPSVPILAGVVITADDGVVRVHTFDYEQARTAHLPGATVTAPGRVLVPAKVLTDMVGKLPKGRKGTSKTPAVPAPTVTFTADAAKLVITAGRTRFTLATLPIEEYPQIPAVPATVGAIDGKVLAAAVAQVAPTAGKDDTLPILTGLHVNLSAGGAFTIDATDRFRLASFDGTYAPAADAADVAALVPAKTLAAVAKLAGKTGGTVTIGADTEGALSLQWGTFTIVTRLLDGDFPKIRALMPDGYAHTATVDAGELVEVVDRVSVALERAAPVRLAFTGEELTVKAGSEDYDAGASEAMSAAWSGGKLVTAFNHKYLTDAVKAAGTSKVRIGFNDGTKPAVFHPLDSDGEVIPGYRHLVMPVRIVGAAKKPEAKPEVETPAEAVAEAEKLDARRAADAAKAEPAPVQAEPAPEPTDAGESIPDDEPATPTLDPTVPHVLTPRYNGARHCRCGKTRLAKVHVSASDLGAATAAPAPAEPVAEPTTPAPVQPVQPATPAEPVAGKVIRIVRTEDHGTILFGTEYGDGSLEVVGRKGLGWVWAKTLGHFYLGDRGEALDRPAVDKAADALRVTEDLKRGGLFTVDVQVDEYMPEDAVKAAKAEAKALAKRQPATVERQPVAAPVAEKSADVPAVELPAVTGSDNGGLVWARFSTDTGNLKAVATELRVLVGHLAVKPANDGHQNPADQVKVSVYRDNDARTLQVTAYPPASGRALDVDGMRRTIIAAALGVEGVKALIA